MIFELNYFQTLIRKDLTRYITLPPHEAAARCRAIEAELDRIINSFHGHFLTQTRDNFRKLVRYHQELLVMFSDQLTAAYHYNDNLIGVGRQEPGADDVIATLSDTIAELLGYLQQTYHEHFDLARKAPVSIIQQVAPQIRAEAVFLRTLVPGNTDNPRLVHNILAEMEKLVARPETAVLSYGAILSLHRFNEELAAAFTGSDMASAASIVRLLVAYNINMSAVMQCVTEYIESGTHGSDPAERMQYLEGWQKLIRQTTIKANATTDTSAPMLRKQLLQWLEIEMQFPQADQPAMIKTPGLPSKKIAIVATKAQPDKMPETDAAQTAALAEDEETLVTRELELADIYTQANLILNENQVPADSKGMTELSVDQFAAMVNLLVKGKLVAGGPKFNIVFLLNTSRPKASRMFLPAASKKLLRHKQGYGQFSSRKTKGAHYITARPDQGRCRLIYGLPPMEGGNFWAN